MLHLLEMFVKSIDNLNDLNDKINCDTIKKLGFEQLGSGYFATVYGMPNCHYAYKVGPLNDGWLLWAAFCRKHESTYAPKIDHIKRFEENGFYIARMEKCKETYCHYSRRTNTASLHELVGRGLEVTAQGEEMFPGLTHFLSDATDFGYENSLKTDLHDDNAMLRFNGELVITDPFSSRLYGPRTMCKAILVIWLASNAIDIQTATFETMAECESALTRHMFLVEKQTSAIKLRANIWQKMAKK